jgi:heat shock protein HslJ
MKTNAVVSILAAGVLLAACATEPKEPPPKPFTGTRWQSQLGLRYAGEKPWVRFSDGRLEGFGGCNRIAARYVEDSVGASAIAIGRIESGRHACDAEAQALEESLLGVLRNVSSYTITGDLLTMTGSGGALQFRAVPEESKR